MNTFSSIIKIDDEGNIEKDMIIGILPESLQDMASKIFDKCAKQGESFV